MNDYLVAEFLNSADTIITQPIQLTQRIKYTSYDVSMHYIIFGANSGGLYIFNRHPCEFIKLIPSTEGSVVYLCISNDEKIIAVATSKGTLFLVNINETASNEIPVYNQHQENTITAMKWHDNNNELFIGDNTGKISVFIVNFITKAMFQTPCTTLMQLDSRIVQLDVSSHFLLVSTLSRCYLCDTDAEKYHQLGKKLRDGEFGACFLGHRYVYTNNERRFELRTFRFLSDNEPLVTCDGTENLKMICARPGSRLWEVQLDGTVVRTHQFKQALAIGPSNIIQINYDVDCRLNTKPNTTTNPNTFSCNFIKLYVLDYQFIVAYQKNGLYIFDPQNASVIFWTDVYKDIVDVKIVNKFLYLWTAKKQMHVLTFSNLENFVIKCLLNKQYLLCADLCIMYQKNIKKLLPLSKKLYLLSTLSEKLLEKNAFELNDKFEPVLTMIKEFSIARQAAQKLSSGIFVIDNAHFVRNSISVDSQTPPDINDPIGVTYNSEEIQICATHSEPSKFDETLEKTFDSVYEEYKHHQTHALEQILHKQASLTEIINIFIKFEEYIRNLNVPDLNIKNWCYEKCITYLQENKSSIHIIHTDISDEYLLDAFLNIKPHSDYVCSCGYPLPKASQIKPQLYDIISPIVNKLCITDTDTVVKLCHKVPYIWKHIIKLRENDDLNNILPLILQYSDIDILKEFTQRLTYDMWNEVVIKFILLKQFKCLNCEHKFAEDQNTGITWAILGTLMVKSIGGESTVYLFQEYAEDIPNSGLDIDFYQSAILTTMIDNFDTKLRNRTTDLVITTNKNNKAHIGTLLEKMLHKPESSSSKDTYITPTENDSICSFCQMPLRVPVLSREEYVELKCGHTYHKLCFKSQNSLCSSCSYVTI